MNKETAEKIVKYYKELDMLYKQIHFLDTLAHNDNYLPILVPGMPSNDNSKSFYMHKDTIYSFLRGKVSNIKELLIQLECEV